ncbi:hypothetical protein [Kitasatospora purpeofusca]|uniref:hypothetical protein n=1 Tax=Kitasatospora purpeofusca TaxID=67352 RepID=UPI0038641486|nr:hypothetical protein OIP63_37485 [Kitasatospora purpeofusca]
MDPVYSRPVRFGALTLRFTGLPQGGPRLDEPNGEGWRALNKEAGSWILEARDTDPHGDMVRPAADWEKLGELPTGDVVWRMVPPDGYRTFSDFLLAPGQDPRHGPDEVFGCVKESHGGFTYAHPADVATPVIADLWPVVAPDHWCGTNGIRMTPSDIGGFCWSPGAKPVDRPPMHVLNLPIGTQRGTGSKKPLMDGFGRPADVTNWAREQVATVPFPAVKDSDRSVLRQIRRSPVYTIQRDAQYRLEKYIDNEHRDTAQSVGYSVTKGVSQIRTATWRARVGISVTAKGGIDIEAVDAGLRATVSVELGYSSATGVSELVSRTDTGALRVPGRHAGAMYSVTHRLTAFREDGTPVGGAAGSLTFTPDQDYYFVQYPEADGDGNSVEKLSLGEGVFGNRHGGVPDSL